MKTNINSEKTSRPFEEGMTIEERAVVYGFFNEGLKVNEIQELWSDVFQRDKLTNRQLYLYREKWVEGGRKHSIDCTASWSETKSFLEHGINIDHLSVLNDVDNWIVHEFRGFLPKLSYRLLYWCSHVLSLAPELEEEVDLFVLGARFALRNIAYSYTRRHSDETDLDDLLSYRPWRSKERDEKYRAAQIRGDVSKLKELAPVLSSRYRLSSSNFTGSFDRPARSSQISLSENEVRTPIGRQMLFLEMVYKMCLGDGFTLPSVRIQSLRSEGINPIEINFLNESGATVRTRY